MNASGPGHGVRGPKARVRRGGPGTAGSYTPIDWVSLVSAGAPTSVTPFFRW